MTSGPLKYNRGDYLWYYRNVIDDSTVVYSLLKADTKHEDSKDRMDFIKRFKECLKNGYAGKRNIINYILAISIGSIPELTDVHHWGLYPASHVSPGSQYGLLNSKPIMQRKRDVEKRHNKLPFVRIKEGCDIQFDSIAVNECYRGQLKSKKVCIIDDYLTYGTSCETTRHLMNHADVDKLYFITVGKYGDSYYKYNYNISGDIHSGYSFARIGRPKCIKGIVNNEQPGNLVDIIKEVP